MRALRGCLDRLPRLQSSALVLRYGIGWVDARSVGRAARELNLSRRRFRQVERRGLRSLVMAGRRSSCEQTAVQRSTISAVYGVVPDEPFGGRAFILTTESTGSLQLASAPTGDVAGVRASSDDDDQGSVTHQDRDSPEAGPSLRTPFGDVAAGADKPLFILFALLALAATAVAARVIVRAIR